VLLANTIIAVITKITENRKNKEKKNRILNKRQEQQN
jgi:hypothetical protein